MFVENLSKKEILEFWKGVLVNDPNVVLIKREIKEINDKKLGKGFEMISQYQNKYMGMAHHAAGNTHEKNDGIWTENVKLFDFEIKSENSYVQKRQVQLWHSFLKIRCGNDYRTNLNKQLQAEAGRGM